MPSRSLATYVIADGDERASSYGHLHSPDHVVCWASVTKVFTAALTHGLISAGALSWDEPVGTVIGVELPDSITARSLVEHRAGLPPLLPQMRGTDPYAGWTPERFEEALPELASLQHKVGEYRYSNLGYALLGLALEKSGGARWIDLLRWYVIEPLGVPGLSVGLAGRDMQPQQVTNWRRRPLPDWQIGHGPFAFAGGLCASLPTMAELLVRSKGTGSLLSPSRRPHAWINEGNLTWHNGMTLRTGSFVAIRHTDGTIAAAHVLGGIPGLSAGSARRAVLKIFGTGQAATAAGRGEGPLQAST